MWDSWQQEDPGETRHSDDTSHFLLPGDHVQQVHALAGWYADLQVPLPAQVDSSLPPCRALTWPPGLELRYLLPSAAALAAELYAITEQVQQQTLATAGTP